MDICASAAHLRVLVGLRAARDVHAVYRARLLHGKVKLIGVALLSLLAQLLQCAIGIGGSCIVKRRQSPKRGRLSAEQGDCNWGKAAGWPPHSTAARTLSAASFLWKSLARSR